VPVEEAGIVPAVLEWVKLESQLAYAQRRFMSLRQWLLDFNDRAAARMAASMGACSGSRILRPPAVLPSAATRTKSPQARTTPISPRALHTTVLYPLPAPGPGAGGVVVWVSPCRLRCVALLPCVGGCCATTMGTLFPSCTDDTGVTEGSDAEVAMEEEPATGDSSAPPKPPSAEPPSWVTLIDPASGFPYYYNPGTGVSQWEPPSGWGGHRPPDKVEEPPGNPSRGMGGGGRSR
jgi:hypothetical protein